MFIDDLLHIYLITAQALKLQLHQRHHLNQFFPNCVQQHTGVPLKRLKCGANVLCFEKTFCMLHHFRYKVCEE